MRPDRHAQRAIALVDPGLACLNSAAWKIDQVTIWERRRYVVIDGDMCATDIKTYYDGRKL